MKVAAKKTGISVDEYIALLSAGLKRCTKCKEWRSQSLFNRDERNHSLRAVPYSGACIAVSDPSIRFCCFRSWQFTDIATADSWLDKLCVKLLHDSVPITQLALVRRE